jgi:protein-S-isoprenylcysteine O-methyltransferase Ste14
MAESHNHGKNLAGEHALTDIGQLILAVMFLATWIVDSFWLHVSTFPSEHVAFYIRLPLGLASLAAGLVLIQKSHKAIFETAAERSVLMTSGVYAIVRHPMYLGTILLCLGFIIATLSLLSAGVWIVIIAFYYLVSRYEEELLLLKFCDDYVDYRSRVPMMFPLKLGKYPSGIRSQQQ